MSEPVRFASEASSEPQDAVRWYEDQRAGLGAAFLAAVEATVDLLVRWPRSGAVITGVSAEPEIRRLPVYRFPYHVAYVITEDQIYVLAVAHDRRRPRYWRGRVAG